MKSDSFINLNTLRVLYQNRKLIIITSLISFIFFICVSLILPLCYRAYTTILPPVDESGMFDFSSLMSDLPLKALGLGGVSEQSDLLIATLKSRTVMDAVAKEYNLMERYKAKNLEETIKELRKHMGVRLDDEGTITLFAEARTPWFSIFDKDKKEEARVLAKDMANFFIAELDRVNKSLKSDRAKNTRIFIEKRYQQNLDYLYQAEEAMKVFQEQYGAIAMTEQTAATISAAAEIKAQIVAKEVEIEVLENSMGSNHHELIRAQKELNALNRKFNEFKSNKRNIEVGGKNTDLFLPLNDVPDLGLLYARHFRDVLIQEKIMEFLLPQYEQAKIQEARDTPTIQVLDEAVKPIRKHKPKRAIFVLFYCFLIFILISVYYTVKPSIISLLHELQK